MRREKIQLTRVKSYNKDLAFLVKKNLRDVTSHPLIITKVFFGKLTYLKPLIYSVACPYSAAVTVFKNFYLHIREVLVILQTNRLKFIISLNCKVFTKSAVHFRNLCLKLHKYQHHAQFQCSRIC